MTSYFLVLGCGLLGALGHWVTRWSQGRTESSFPEYLLYHKSSTVSALFSILASTAVIYQTLPTEASGRDLLMSLLGAYSSGYMLDSTVNRDKPMGEG